MNVDPKNILTFRANLTNLYMLVRMSIHSCSIRITLKIEVTSSGHIFLWDTFIDLYENKLGVHCYC